MDWLEDVGQTWAYAAPRDSVLETITVEQTNAASRKYVKPDDFLISTAGDFKWGGRASN